MRTLTGGDEKLVHAVDYVKGNLVHDIIGMVQRILDDHLKVNPKVHVDLSKKLELLGNFLKNLYKDHVKVDDGDGVEWAAHSVHHGLKVPESVHRYILKEKERVSFVTILI